MPKSYKQNNINDLDSMLNESDPVLTDDVEEELEMPKLNLDLQVVEEDTLNKAKNIVEKLNADDDFLFLQDDDNKIQVLLTGAPYITDKLYNYKQSLENEVLTYLGVNNLGTSEKKEHLITAEVNSNNELISQSGENFLSMMEDFCERIKKVLDIDISVKIKAKDEEMIDLDLEEDEENKEEENV